MNKGRISMKMNMIKTIMKQILKLDNTITELKNSLEGFNNKLDQP